MGFVGALRSYSKQRSNCNYAQLEKRWVCSGDLESLLRGGIAVYVAKRSLRRARRRLDKAICLEGNES